ncbi:DNA-dependent protein kinase catalytic subunit-like isoform X1 [Montipora capricornis]|uniref:DNA-dependent protein kinase catalytic subunit-like isoform X1 n=1 Tax=Montipora capricornis TaxID=246305 RepID=UPI0035F20544
MSDPLSRYLEQLHSLLLSDAQQRGVDANNLVVDLSSFCLENPSDRGQAYRSSLLFHEKKGIISFLKIAVTRDEFLEAKLELLRFLQSYVMKLDMKINPYVVVIKEICMKLFSQDRSNKVKGETFPLLSKIFGVKLESSVVEKLNIPRMIEKYFGACMQPTKHSSTVKSGLYALLGTFAEVFPEHMIVQSDRLVSIYINLLKSEMMSRTKKPDMPVIAGCLHGLTRYLTNFTQSVEEGSKYSQDIYNYARKSIDPQVSWSRYEVPRAGLQLFAKHAAQFNEYICSDYEDMYESLYRWCRHHNRDVSYTGYLAMETFLKQVADYLVKRHGDKSEMILFKYFIKKFQSIIDSASSDTKQTSIAIRGYGYFSKPCKLILPPGDVKVMFSQMMQRSEQIYLRQDELVEDKVQYLPSFLEALSCIVQELDEVSDSILSSLERLVVVLFNNFTRLAKGSKFLCCKALVRLLFNLSTKGPYIRRFLSEVVYQGLIRTCSHPVELDEVNETIISGDGEAVNTNSSPKTSYKDYLPLWEFLLERGKFKDVSLVGEKLEQIDCMHRIVYDEMMKAILRIIHKLDLSSVNGPSSELEGDINLDAGSSSPAQQEKASLSDPVVGLQPKVPKDFLIFVNLTEFCRCVLPKYSVTMFESWVYVFGREIIVMSTGFPVVRGFYKLLEVCLKICEKLSFFKFVKAEKQDNNSEDLDMEIVDVSDRMTCFVLFRKFLKEVLIRMQHYKDDLLASCLRLVLSIPLKIVQLDVASLVPAMKLTFKLGLSYTPLAQAGLDALQKWSASLPAEMLNPCLSEVLPCLDGYLKSSTDKNEEGQLSEDSKTIVLRTASRPGSRRKIPLKLLKIKDEMAHQGTPAPLASVRHEILRLLGSLGGQTNVLLLGGKEIDPSKIVAWDSLKHLGFAVPFQDMKPEIDLDPFLPRLIELATTSSDRQTKVAACESLHSLILYVLGKSVTQPQGKKSPLEKLWNHLFPCLLQLSCDVEQVAEQLFKPLVFQLIHWFTNNRMYESPETIALLDAILDGLVYHGEAALRDFSAQCVREFLQWSIKQTSEKDLEKSPINIKSLLKRLYSLALHPSAAKRLGAALAFNNIYTIFREESSLVDVFILEILANYLESLSLAHNDDQARGTQEQTAKVIEHLERIIKVHVRLLNKENKRRRIPRGFGTLNSITLSHVIPWLLKQCGKPSTECRHQCMRLFCQLAPHVPGVTSAADWIQKTYEDHQSLFVHRFEGGGGGQNGIELYPTLSHIGGPFSLKETFAWFDFLLAALDCYTWSFSQRLLLPSQVFTTPKDGKKSSVLFVSLNFFLTKLALFGITAAKNSFTMGLSSAKEEVFTPKEFDSYNKAKCTVIVRIMNFLTVLLQVSTGETFKILPAEVWNESLFNVVLSCVIEPGVVGFNVGDIEVVEKLPEQTGALCKMLAEKLPGQHLVSLKESTRKKIALGSHCNLFDQLPLPLCGPREAEVDHLRLGLLVQGYQQLHSAGLLLPALAESTPEQFSAKLLSAVYEGVKFPSNVSSSVINLTPGSHQLACKLLDLAFDLGLKHSTLMEYIVQESKIHSKHSDSSLGLLFYITFQTSINGFFIRQPNKHLVQILSKPLSHPFLISCMLNGILDHVIRDGVLRKRYGSSIVGIITCNWSSLDFWQNEKPSNDLKEGLLVILKKVLMLDPKLPDPTQSFFTSLFDTFLCFLRDNSATQAFKCQALELLPYFTKLPEKEIAILADVLHNFVALNFPLKSTEFIIGGPQYNGYIQALDKLLSALVTSTSLMLLELLITIICRESKHVHEDQIQKSLRTFIQRLAQAPDQAKAAMDMCFAFFLNERDYRLDNRRAVIERVCITFLLNTSLAAVRKFYLHCIKDIMRIIEAKQAKPSDPNFESQVTSKLCCFKLVEILYSRLSKSELNTPESNINSAYAGGDVKTGKEMTMAITKAARAAVIEDMRGETVALEVRRQYHCYAYNCLVALISCTQTELKFYVAFLFSENAVKGQLLLDNLVDCTKTYEFEVELSAPVEKRQQMTAIRKEAGANNLDKGNESGSPGETGASLHYICSQYLADSSLSEDVSQYDFSTPIQAYSKTESTLKPSTSKENGEDSYQLSEDIVEMDELNSHECMGKMKSLLKHLLENRISPEPPKGIPSVEMPAWMSPLHKKLTSSNTHLNICLFIAKLIIDEPQIFEPYAKFWLTPLTELILRMKESDQPGSEGINYFIVDLVVTMLSWNNTAIPEDRHLTNKLLEFMMSRTQHRNRSIFKNNLEIIKSMVEVWKSRLEVPTKMIFDNLSNPDPTKKDNAAGIQLLGIIAANGLSPISHNSTIDEERFYSSLVNNLSFKYKEVHAATAEVIGLLLKQAAEIQKVFDGPLHDMVTEKLTALVNSVNPEPGKFISCVHKLQLNYPPIADRFVNQILFKLPSVYGDFKTYCLEILCSRAEYIPNLFTELKTKGLKDVLTYRDEGSQVAALRILQRLLKKLTVPELQFMFPSVTAFISHPSILCRELMYDILIWIYDVFRSDEMFRAEKGAAEILTEAKNHLLEGLADDNRDLRLKLRNFWSDESRLPGTTLERLVEVLRAMYSPSTENQYLGYTTNLILHLTSLSPDYGRMMFDQPLSECKFQEYQINYSWQQRHLLMTPLFAATQSSFGPGITQTQSSMSVDGVADLRATQNLLFTPTQDQGRSETFDWLNPSQETTPFQPYVTTPSQSQSSLLFSTSQSKLKQKAFLPVPRNFGSQRMVPPQESSQQFQGTREKKELLRLKRRFLKESNTSDFFAKREAMRNTLKMQAKERRKTARESRVVMYRKYRTGDLPDVQIKFSELIAPLQAVAQRDSTFAKQLFSVLFRGVFSQIEEKLSEREARNVTSDVKTAVNNMISSTTQFFPPFISSLQDICYHEQKLSIDPTTVSTACLTSLQQPIGIMLLEKQLLQSEDDGQSRHKRARSTVSPPSEVTTTWIELSKLYRSLGDYDVLRGIFTGHIGTKPITQEALEAEARGDFSQALKLYNEAIATESWTSGEPQQEEEDLWDDGRLQCFANLTQWENLEKFSVLNIDDSESPDLDKVWTDTFLQEHYLPHMITSKLKLQCQWGEDQSLCSFVTRAMQNNDWAALLQGRHSDSLALLYVLQDDYDRAKHFAGTYEQSFLVDWAGLDSMMSASRSAKLQSLQKMAEMQEFLEFITKEENFSSDRAAETLLEKWSSRLPDPRLHSVIVWDDIVTNRIVYMRKILKKFEAFDADERSGVRLDDLKNSVLQQEVELYLHMANAAKEQGNYQVGNKCLREALKLIPQDDDSLQISWSHAYAKVHHKKTQTLTAVETVETALMVTGQLEKYGGSKILETDSLRALQHHILRSQALDGITKVIFADEGLVLSALDDSKKEMLARLCGSLTSADSHRKVVSQLMKQSFASLQSAIKAAKKAEEKCKGSVSSGGMVQAMMAMVNFCDNCLRKKEEDTGLPVEVDTKLFPGIVVRYMLKAMCYNSDEARQRFPRLLQIVQSYPDTLQAFISKASDVPCWMFIGWINQMLAVLDKHEGKAVHAILQEIAQTYPQALWYPFKISNEQFVFENSEEGKANKETVNSLQSSLDSSLVNDFIAALEQLTNPEMVFKDWCEGPMKQLLEDKNKRTDAEAIKECFQNMFQNLLDSGPRAKSSSQIRGNEFGSIRKRFAQEFSSEVQRLFGKTGEKINGLDPKEFLKQWKTLHQKMEEKRSLNLKDYSPWLLQFQSSNHTYALEIPGQYTGRGKPLPEYHVKIAGFDERVLVLTSIRRPKRIIIRGDDEKDHMFLVKGGEDLRLDQRIEQLFCLMNDIMSDDPACRQRGLRLRTYQVIPMTPRVGLIEWMQNTKLFKDMLQDTMTRTERENYSAKDGPRLRYLKWIEKFKGNKTTNLYGEMYKKASRTETERSFHQRVGLVPWDLLRRAFIQLSASPEAFLTLRSHFAKTHACLSVCQYILGIGDRHLSNFMVDMETGGMIGIDFGHAFGSATQFLPFPELMPFRLTRQLINLMLPLKESGTLQSVMVHTLRALTNNHELLMNTMDVFIKEPSLDWQVFARKQAKTQGINSEDKDAAWYPRQKIQNARKKLEGFNPAFVMRDDLMLGHKSNPWYKPMEAVCLGDEAVNIRAREPESGLSVESQVACLIDQAMDPNILGRTYDGWEPWM